MSFAANLAKILSASTRADKVAVIASETDETTGIINNTTEVTKEYFESLGPNDDTGTIFANILDLYEVLTNAQQSTSLNLMGMVRFSADGLSLRGGAPADNQVRIGEQTDLIRIYGTTLFDEAVGFTTDVSCGGDVVMSGTSSNSLKLGRCLLDVYDDALTNGSVSIFGADADGDFRFHLPLDPTDAYNVTPPTGYGRMITGAFSWWLDGENRLHSELKDLPLMILDATGNLTLGTIDDVALRGRVWDPGTFAQFNSVTAAGGGSIHRLISMASEGVNKICFQGVFDPDGGDDDNGSSVFSIEHIYDTLIDKLVVRHESSGYSENILMEMSIDDGYQLARFKASYSGTDYAELHMQIMSSNDFNVDISPQQPSVNNRAVDGDGTSTPSLLTDPLIAVPGIRLTNGNSTYSYGRVGFDSWNDNAALRLWADDINGTLRGLVAIGPPAGTRTSPIDRLVYIPELEAIGINVNNIELSSGFAGYSGLWIGRHGDTYAARLCMQDSSGHRATIRAGTVAEDTLVFFKDGCLRTIDGDADETNVGNTGDLGGHKIPVVETSYELTGGNLADIITELEAEVDDETGSTALVHSATSGSSWLFVSNGTEWEYFVPAGIET